MCMAAAIDPVPHAKSRTRALAGGGGMASSIEAVMTSGAECRGGLPRRIWNEAYVG